MITTPFPAIVIGGPPHSGKSVLTYSLTQALREQAVEHYVLRACPDGEGDWSNEASLTTVRRIRYKGQFTPQFIHNICQDLQHRPLPLLVDVGGRPTAEQEAIFDQCTHAVLLAPDEQGLSAWRTLATRHGLTILAELRSTLTESEQIDTLEPLLRGQIAGLERGRRASGPLFAALCLQISTLFAYQAGELRRLHLEQAPVELTVDLDRLYVALNQPQQPRLWTPAALPAVLEYLPVAPLAVYGRAPGWLYAALARYIHPEPFFQFDARLGWVEPVKLSRQGITNSQPVAWHIQSHAQYTYVDIKLTHAHLDYHEAKEIQLPLIPLDCGLVISGKLPHWLLTGLVLAYQSLPWIGIYQPQLQEHAVVIGSNQSVTAVGSLVPLTEAEN